MKKIVVFLTVLFVSAAFAWSDPVVDGKVAEGEYSKSIPVLGGSATIYYQKDAQGGLFVALKAKTNGWAGIGFGSQAMDGAYIFMGYVKDGKPVFSEQKGSGHHHSDSGTQLADQSAVIQTPDSTVVEFHIPAGKLPFSGSTVDYIVASAQAADLKTRHDKREGGSFSF